MYNNISLPESYQEESFEEFWKLLKLSNDKIFNINWSENDLNKIKEYLINLNFKLKDSKSSNLIGFSYKFNTGDFIEGGVALSQNKIYWSFHFVSKKADNLISWLEKKYGKSLDLRDEMTREYRYDWIDGDILIEAEMAKLSKYVSIGLQKWPEYTKMIRGEISHDEFLKEYEK